jgi:4-diphosphocytidyl-2-C-methyl-D-erythritol kinase
MREYEAPAKLNLSLHVMPPAERGYHPLSSIVQTIEWLDRLEVEKFEEGSDSLEVTGRNLEAEENLVLKAVEVARGEFAVPVLRMVLYKDLPVAAGLGGGSSDAAAALLAARDVALWSGDLDLIASKVGADVPLFLTGGTLMMGGFGERIDRLRPREGFAVAVAVPEFGLDTAEVYAKWDELEGPEGTPVPDDRLPPSLRGEMPMRNDLLPAALAVEPRLGDFMADVRSIWNIPVCLTGSGSACFGYFPSLGEATEAAAATSTLCSVARGVALRDHGVALNTERVQ